MLVNYLVILDHNDKHGSVRSTRRFVRMWAIFRMKREFAGWFHGICVANGRLIFHHCLTLPGHHPTGPFNHL
ncbi:hypothetical protein HanRHA438_Chr13g0601081 [Helianthus annuus]|nr:hypothetical protein HanRHA438_Chr13g0601081 [Helianthus annuus]